MARCWSLWIVFLALQLPLQAENLSQALADLGLQGERAEKARQTLLANPSKAAALLIAHMENVTIRLDARIAKLIRDLDSRVWRKRERATRDLERVGSAALHALDRAGTSRNAEVSWRAKLAATAIRKQGTNKAEQRLRRRQAVVRLLSELGDARALAVLANELGQDGDPSIPPTAAIGLGRIGLAQAAPMLLANLSHKDWIVRSNVIWALGRIKSTAAVAPLLKTSRDRSVDDYLRTKAIRALRNIAGAAPTTLRPICIGLAQLLADPAWEVRSWAAQALRELAGKKLGYRYDDAEAARIRTAKAWQAWAAKLPS